MSSSAEVVRMYQTLVGRDGFRKGMDLYFERHDGQAVTCDDFRAAMADANGRDLRQFERWYSQAGTPVVTARTRYDAVKRNFDIILSQRSNHPDQLPFHIPVAVGLLGADGRDLPLTLDVAAQLTLIRLFRRVICRRMIVAPILKLGPRQERPRGCDQH